MQPLDRNSEPGYDPSQQQQTPVLPVTRQAVSQCELEQQPAVVMLADVQCQPAGQECVTDS